MFTPEFRTAIYGLAVAAIALAVGYGLVTEELAALWVAVVAGAISSATAWFNRPTKVDPIPPAYEDIEVI